MGSAPEYQLTAPEQLKLDFILDNTNTIEGNVHEGITVAQQVKMLQAAAYWIDSESHRPGRLKIQWGTFFTFDCVLSSMDISYVLFSADGAPLRAKVSVNFIQYVEDTKRVAKENKKSPDLYRSVRVMDGDTLPMLTYKSYGDPALYQKVAYYNELVSVRALQTDQELAFPPVKDSNNE
jgi:LysM repeat protein